MARVLLSALLAIGIVLGIFLLMNALIDTAGNQEIERDNINVDIGFIEEEKDVQRKERTPPKKPPPPKEPPPPQQQDVPEQKQVVTALVDIKIDNIDATMDGGGIFIGGLGSTDFSGMGDGEAIPLVTVPPEYPQRAAFEGIEGFVMFQFDIAPDGTPSNIRVIDENPRGMFRREALRAIRKWKFKPRIVNGQPIHQRDMKYKLDFQLDN